MSISFGRWKLGFNSKRFNENSTSASKDIVSKESAQGNMGILLMLQMEEYIQKTKEVLETQGEDTGQLVEAYGKLARAGLENSKNAKLLKQKIDSISLVNNNIRKAGDLLRFMKDLRSHFGNTTLLVGTEQFEKVCKKYRLATGVINRYTGTIPDKNLKELQAVIEKCKTFLHPLNCTSRGLFLWDIHEIEASYSIRDDDEVKAAKDWIEKQGGIIFANASRYLRTGAIGLSNVRNCNPSIPDSLRTYRWDNLLQFRGTQVTETTMFIACPPSQLREQSLKITTKAQDPIVFQRSEYGIIIHTMWGEEAEDIVFKKYCEANNLLID